MIKNKIIKLLHLLGVFNILKWIHRNKIIILYVHGVAQAGSNDKWQPLRLPLSPEIFERQLKIISRHYDWISLDEAADMISGKSEVRPYCITLTFDDGYMNNMTVALPFARKLGIKPAFYIPTGFVSNRKPFWFDRFDFVIQQFDEAVDITLGNELIRFFPDNRNALRRTFAELRSHAKSHFNSDEEFEEFFDQTCSRLEKLCGKSIRDIQPGDKWSSTLSDADLASLSRSNQVTIGSHTVDHVRLDKVVAEKCRKQLVESKDYIENVVGEECHHFCYPNGSVNNAVADRVSESGYVSATTTDPGFNRTGDSLFLLKRFHMPDYADEARLLSLLSGFLLMRDRAISVFRRGSDD